MSDDIKKAAEDLIVIGDKHGVYDLSMLTVARAYLALRAQVDQLLKGLEAYSNESDYNWGAHFESKGSMLVSAAIKAIEEGRA